MGKPSTAGNPATEISSPDRATEAAPAVRPSADLRTTALRIAAIVMAALPLSGLAIASRLEPNSRGLGTHQQLGLPPCSLRVMFGIRCPSCGMTTSWAHFTRGQWEQSFRVNSGGFLLAFYGIYVAALSLTVARSGTWPSVRRVRRLTYVTVGIAVVTLLDWIARLAS